MVEIDPYSESLLSSSKPGAYTPVSPVVNGWSLGILQQKIKWNQRQEWKLRPLINYKQVKTEGSPIQAIYKNKTEDTLKKLFKRKWRLRPIKLYIQIKTEGSLIQARDKNETWSNS